LLGEEQFRRQAGEIAEWSACHEGAAAAAEHVENTARNTTSRPSPARK
jgi:hypothetical protein